MFTTLALNTLLLAYPAPRDREPPDKGPGFLGVTFEGLDAQADGVQLTEIRPDGPAMRAGLKVGDIIRKFNGEQIGFDTFAKKIIRIRPGTAIPMEVHRGAETVTIKVKIGVRPDDFPYPLPDLDERPVPDSKDLLPPILPDPQPKK